MTGELAWKGLFNINQKYGIGDIVKDFDTEFLYICVAPTSRIPPHVPESGFEVMNDFRITHIDGGSF